MKSHLTLIAEPGSRFCCTTAEFARQYKVEPQTVRKQYSATGSYFGTVPLRLPNRRLLWPNDAIDRLLSKASTAEGGL